MSDITTEASDLAETLVESGAALPEHDRIAELETARDALQGVIDQLATEVATLTAERDALQAKLDKADKAAKAKAAPAPKKPRKVGSMKDVLYSDLNELRALIADAGTVELVFSNGKTEIAGLPPLTISGEAWAFTVPGLALRVPNLTITGPANGAEIAGYGLFIEGEQVAWSPRGDVMRVPAGQTSDISNDVIFAG